MEHLVVSVASAIDSVASSAAAAAFGLFHPSF